MSISPRMEGSQESDHGQHVSVSHFSSSSNTASINGPSSSSPPTSTSQVQEEEETNEPENEDNNQEQQQQRLGVSYHLNISIFNATGCEIKDDVWSCLVVLVTFWCFASMTLILGFYGSVTLQLGPNCSRLIQTNSFFVQSIKAEELDEQKPGLMVYGFHKPPPLDVEVSWTETHNAFVSVNFHKEWIFFLNKGSKVDVSYKIISPRSSPLCLVVAQGRESLLEWIEDPSYPNTTLSWTIIFGSGKIQQEISKSENYYIAVGNFNPEEVEVQLKFTMEAFIYNTTPAYYRCSLGNNLCNFKLHLLGAKSAVLTSPGRPEGILNDPWYVKVSYGPRWITYFIGSGVMTVLVLLAFRLCNLFQTTSRDGRGFQSGVMVSEQAPLMLNKDDDLLSWGSSYDSLSHDEDNLEDWLAESSLEGKPSNEGKNDNPRRLCVICCDSPRDCFFLPCGHCAACSTCGTRIAEEAGTCPICRRKTKKVRKVFTV